MARAENPRRRRLRWAVVPLLAALGMVAATAGPAAAGVQATGVTAAAATAHGSTTLTPPSATRFVMSSASPADTQQIDHACRVIGSDSGGHQAVSCADLYVSSDGAGDVTVFGGNELFCQTPSGTILECAGIHETAALCSSHIPNTCVSSSGVCGVRFGHSACGVRRVENVSPAAGVAPGVCAEDIWGDSLDASIVLPGSGLTVGGPGTNEATQHWEVCNPIPTQPLRSHLGI